jgi:ATP-dependent DNA helicase RecG
MNGLDMEIQFLPGVGPKRADLLKKELGVSTVGDLLRLYPFRHIDKSSIVRIADARPDMAYLQIRARVLRVELYGAASSPIEGPQAGENTKEKAVKFNTVKRMSVWIGDGSAEMEAVFFKGIKWMHEKLKVGEEFIFFGKPTSFNGRINIVHPEVDACTSAENRGASSSADRAMTGVYNSTEKLKNSGITGKIMTKIMNAALEKGLPCMEETLPEHIMKHNP